MSSSILFFQASATAIPTLFIAYAFTSKATVPGDENPFGITKNDFKVSDTNVGLLLPISSEAVALATLAENRPTAVAQYWVAIGVISLLGYLFMAVTVQYKKRWDEHFLRTTILAFGIPTIVFMGFINILEALP